MPSDPDVAASPLAVSVRGEVDDAQWDDLCDSDPRCTFFQRARAHRAAGHSHRGWDLRWMVAQREERLVAGLPLLRRRKWGVEDWVSGIGGGYGGPIAAPGEEDAETQLAQAFARLGGWRQRRLELVWAGTEPPRGRWEGLRPLGTAVVDVDADLDFEDLLRARLPKNRRNESRRSEKRGLRVEVDERGEALAEFYPLYQRRCEEWKSSPVPESYLQSLLVEGEPVRFFVARDAAGRTVGGHVTVELPGQLFAWVGTTERSGDTYPSSLLIREELRWCHAQRVGQLNLGTSLGIEGVQNYKRLLGAREDRRWILQRRARWSRWLGR